MNVLIFKTDIETKRMENALKPIFNNDPSIFRWTVDKEDIDNVLRIVCNGKLNEKEVIGLVKQKGFFCEVLCN